MPHFAGHKLQNFIPNAKSVSATQGKSTNTPLTLCFSYTCKGCRIKQQLQTTILNFSNRLYADHANLFVLFFSLFPSCIIIPILSFCFDSLVFGHFCLEGKGVYGFFTGSKGQAASGFAKNLHTYAGCG